MKKLIIKWYKRLTGIHVIGGGDLNNIVKKAKSFPWWRSKTIFLKDGLYYISGNLTLPKNVELHVDKNVYIEGCIKIKATCWCGKELIESVGGMPLGFLCCPTHYSYCQPGDEKHFIEKIKLKFSSVIDDKIKKGGKEMSGKKNDQDLYKKVDYSLVPLKLIIEYLDCKIYNGVPMMNTGNKNFLFFSHIYKILNYEAEITINKLLKQVIEHYDIKPLASSLGVGITKYNERDNWKKFDSDPDRFLRAALRHLIAIMTGTNHDHEEGITGYDKGNDHRGAVCFNLMVADNIINKGQVTK